MITLLSLYAAVAFVGAIMLAIGIFRAPEGYEDDSGFHLLWANNSPQIRDVACIWACALA